MSRRSSTFLDEATPFEAELLRAADADAPGEDARAAALAALGLAGVAATAATAATATMSTTVGGTSATTVVGAASVSAAGATAGGGLLATLSALPLVAKLVGTLIVVGAGVAGTVALREQGDRAQAPHARAADPAAGPSAAQPTPLAGVGSYHEPLIADGTAASKAPPVLAPIPTPVAPALVTPRAPSVEAPPPAPTTAPADPRARRAASASPAPRPGALAAPVGPEPTDALGRELALLERVQDELGAGRADAALARLGDHATLYPSGALGPEAGVLRVEALVLAGRAGEAEDAARTWLAAHAGSPLSARVRGAISGGTE